MLSPIYQTLVYLVYDGGGYFFLKTYLQLEIRAASFNSGDNVKTAPTPHVCFYGFSGTISY